MVYRITVITIIVVSIIMALLALNVGAVEFKIKGLAISPTRQNITATSDHLANGTFEVANASVKPLTINLSVKQFTATNYTYDYLFSDPQEDWIKLGQTQIKLQPGEKMKIKFTTNVPSTAKPGGHYFAFFASSDITDTGVRQTTKVVSLLYMKVTGDIVQTGAIEDGSSPFLVMGSEIPYKFNAKNTGNIDFSAFFFGQLDGLLNKVGQTGTSHVVLPGTVRTIDGSVPAPLLPGVYRLTYGYKTDFDQQATTKTAYVLYIPPWSGVVMILLAYGGWSVWKWRRSKHSAKPTA